MSTGEDRLEHVQALGKQLKALIQEHVPDDTQVLLAICRGDTGTIVAVHYDGIPQVVDDMLLHLRAVVEETGGSIHVITNPERSDQ